MSPHELDRALRELRRATPARRRALWRKVTSAAKASWYDHAWHARVEALAGELGLPVPCAPVLTLAPGETFLLLYDSVRGTAETARLRCGGSRDAGALLSAEANQAVDDAYAATLLWAAQRGRTFPTGIKARQVALELGHGTLTVDGRSLGLAAALALASAATDQAVPATMAATASVDASGALRPVAHVTAKLRALRAQQPQVTTVLVAAGQPLEASPPDGVQVVELGTLLEALEHIGMAANKLPERPVEDWDADVERLDKREAKCAHSPQRWLALATEALAAATALQHAAGYESQAHRAVALGALFSAHAGRHDLASAHLKKLDPNQLAPALATLAKIIEATSAIDAVVTAPSPEADQAVALAQQGLDAANALPAHDQTALRGFALGTLGRAYLHARRAAQGIPLLEEAVRWHEDHDAREVARSRVYLATALRHADRLNEARQLIERVLSELAHGPAALQSRTTRLYAELELGRCCLADGDAWAALRAFEHVIHGQESDAAHPRVSAVRGMAAAYRLLGDSASADRYLERCVAVSEGDHTIIIRRLAALAIVDFHGAALPGHEDSETWRAYFEGASPVEVIASQVY